MSSTISITYKLQGDAKDLKALINDADGLKKAFNGAAVQAEQLPKKMGGLSASTKGLLKTLGGLTAGVVSVRALTKAVGNAVGTMKNFERANSELAAVLGKSAKEITNLSDAAVDLGRKTEFTASEVTALQTSLARLGFNDKQILDMQESVLKLAAAVGTDLASAADFSGSALRSFGMKADDAPKLLDIMAKSCSASALSFSKLQASISVVGPVAHSFGLDARDTVSILGVLSNAGFDATSAATALRNILLNLADSNGKLAKGLGHTATTMPEIISALKELRDRGVDLNTTLGMTDKRSVAAFNALISGADDVEQLYINLGDANGALDQMYTTMTDNLEGSVKSLSSAWEGLVLSFRESTGTLKSIVDYLTEMVNKITDIRNADKNKQAAHQADVSNQAKDYYDRLLREYGDDQEAIQKRIAEDMESADKNWHNAVAAAGKANMERAKKAVREEYQRQVSVWYDAKQMMQEVRQLANGAVSPAPTTPPPTPPPTPPATPKTKSLADAIDDYRESVARALEVNKAFGDSTNAVDAGLSMMRSSIASLASVYGSESGEVKAFQDAYDRLAAARNSAADYREFAPAMLEQLKAMKGAVDDATGSFDKESGAVKNLASAYESLMKASTGEASRLAVVSEIDAQLKVMESGISSLISKYGAESGAVKQLVAEYYELLKVRRDNSRVVQAVSASGSGLSGPGAAVQGKTAKKNGLIPGLVGTDLKKFNKETANALTQSEALQTTIGALGGVFRDLAGAVGESAAAWLEWGSNLMSSIAQALPQLTALFVKQNAAATANTAAAASGGASAVASIPYVGPVLAVAAVASILAALASLPKFAKGGVITGPTMGLMGEYHGAVNNPEVVAPLNTLRQYIEPAGIGGHVDFRIRGRDLEGVLRTEERRTSRS